jgi:hypothetical protein
LVDQLGELGCALNAFIEVKLETRGVPQTQTPTNLPTQETGGAIQSLLDRQRITRWPKGHIQHPRQTHISRHFHGRNGDRSHAWITQLAADEFREAPLDFRLNTSLTSLTGHHSIARATSTRAKHSI